MSAPSIPPDQTQGTPQKPWRIVSRRGVLASLITIALVITGGALFWSAQADTPSVSVDSLQSLPDTTALPHHVTAYYFHTTYRCTSCRKIEAYSLEAIEKGFPQELKDGRLVWRVVNVEEQGNEHFVKDYQLYTKSLVLVEENDSTQVRWENLAKVWELLGDKDGFVRYVQDNTRAYLTTGQQ